MYVIYINYIYVYIYIYYTCKYIYIFKDVLVYTYAYIYIYDYKCNYIYTYMYNLTRVNPQVVNTNTLTLWSFSPSQNPGFALGASERGTLAPATRILLRSKRRCTKVWLYCKAIANAWWPRKKLHVGIRKKTPPLFCAFYFCNHETNTIKKHIPFTWVCFSGIWLFYLKKHPTKMVQPNLRFFTIPSRNFGLSISRGQSPM